MKGIIISAVIVGSCLAGPVGASDAPSKGQDSRLAPRLVPIARLPQQNTLKQEILGRLAVVTAQRAPIHQERDSRSVLLSVVGKGTHLAVVEDQGQYLGVLMIDRSTGWIDKSRVRLIASRGAVADAPKAAALLDEAASHLGGSGKRHTRRDSSLFVQQVFRAQGIPLPRRVADQVNIGSPVAWEDLRAGDRLYFDPGRRGRVSLTGIYLGNGYFVYASRQRQQVRVERVLKPYFFHSLVAARRS